MSTINTRTSTTAYHNSSAIKRSYYNDYISKLKIWFIDGTVYAYDNVSTMTFHDFIRADSTGKYFNENIRMNYQYEKLPA